MKLIEFLGIPGSGKSYVRKQLLAQEHSSEIRIVKVEDLVDDQVTKEERNAAKKIGIARYGNLLGFFLTSERFQKMPMAHRIIIIEWYQNLFRNYVVADTMTTDYTHCLFDEGLVHKSISAFVLPFFDNSDFSEQPVREYLENVPHAHTIVSVQCSLEDAVERIEKRTLPRRLAGASSEEVKEFLSNCEKHVSLCLQTLKERNANIISIENTGTLEELRQQVKEKFSLIIH